MRHLLSRCAKCGSDWVKTRYVDAKVPYLFRHCHGCEYEWREKPLDAGPTGTAA